MGRLPLEIGGFSGDPESNEKWILGNLRPMLFVHFLPKIFDHLTMHKSCSTSLYKNPFLRNSDTYYLQTRIFTGKFFF